MPTPARLRAALRVLVERLDTDLEAGRCAVRPPALVHIHDRDIDARRRHVDLHLRALAGHPEDVLAGYRAPPDCIALGVVTEGTNRAITVLSRTGVEVSAARRR